MGELFKEMGKPAQESLLDLSSNPALQSESLLRDLNRGNYPGLTEKPEGKLLPSLFIDTRNEIEPKFSLSAEEQDDYKAKAKYISELIHSQRNFMISIMEPGGTGLRGDDYIDLGKVEDMIANRPGLSSKQVELLAFLERNKETLSKVNKDLNGPKISLNDISRLLIQSEKSDLSDPDTLKLLKELGTYPQVAKEYERLEKLKADELSLYGSTGDWKQAIHSNFIKQGQSGDCYFLCALAGMTDTAKGRQLVHDMIKPVLNEKGGISHYEVKFPGVNESVRVNPPSLAELAIFARETGAGIWPRILEQAWNVVRNKQEPFRRTNKGLFPSTEGGDGGGPVDETLAKLCGKEAAFYHFSDLSEAKLERLLSGINDGNTIITTGTYKSFEGPSTTEALSSNGKMIYAEHAYTVTSFDKERQTITLRNPHGQNPEINNGQWLVTDAEFTIPLKDYRKYFGYMTVAKLE